MYNTILQSKIISKCKNDYVKRHACQIVRTSITRQLPASMATYFELLSHSKSTRNKKLSITLPRVRTKATQNGFYFQGAMIYNSLTRDIRRQEFVFKKIT